MKQKQINLCRTHVKDGQCQTPKSSLLRCSREEDVQELDGETTELITRRMDRGIFGVIR